MRAPRMGFTGLATSRTACSSEQVPGITAITGAAFMGVPGMVTMAVVMDTATEATMAMLIAERRHEVTQAADSTAMKRSTAVVVITVAADSTVVEAEAAGK